MKINRLTIQNFRGVNSAQLHFDGHSLLVGPNNVGKSTICEALDLVLGPDRLNRFPPVEEFDFHNANYLTEPLAEGEAAVPIPIRIEVVITDLNAEIENRCGAHIEFWNPAEKRLLNEGEVDAANPPAIVSCIRLETVARYNPDEDEFEAQTYFSHSPNEPDGQLRPVRKDIKRLFGFIYLRALRTGSRALSLERGSLLDIILRTKGVRTGLWEKSINRLRNLDIGADAADLDPVLQDIERRLARYIPTNSPNRATKLHVSQLTREHLRKTMAFFIAMSKGQDHVPFQHAGTGTLNTLVLALLSFIAELKPDSVIFAMEEPEIAVPPHTQRRIADYLLQKTTQAFVTSHSPYVIERFEPEQTLILSRDDHANILARRVSDASGLKGNDYKRYARQGLTECMLGRGVIVVEGITEFHALPVVARRYEEAYPSILQPLEIGGVAFFDAVGESNAPKFGTFFRELGLKTFSFYDFVKRTEANKKKYTDSFDIDCEHPYTGFEALIAHEVPIATQWAFLENLRDTGMNGGTHIPQQRPDDEGVRKITRAALDGKKSAGWAAQLLETCELKDLPPTITNFLVQVYAQFPKPIDPPPPPQPGTAAVPPPPPSPLLLTRAVPTVQKG